jgi:hypothetical protein
LTIAPAIRAFAIVLLVAASTPAGAQTARPGTFRIVVRDPAKLPIAAAQVTLTSASAPPLMANTNDRGEAVVDAVPPGTYVVTVESPGFASLDLPNITIRSGARTTREVELKIAAVLEQVDVTPPDADRQLLDAFTDHLTPEQIAALPDDPDELLAYLQQLVGDDADIRVDGFSLDELPPGTQIKDIRITFDAASADGAGGPRIEIRTRPGGDRWRNSVNGTVRDESLNARNAFSKQRPSGQTRQYGWTLNGPLARDRTGLSLSINGSERLDQQVVRAAAPGGLFSTLLSQPANRLGFSADLQHQVNDAHTLRLHVERSSGDARNQGIGSFDLPERAFSRSDADGEFRLGHDATIHRSLWSEFKFQVRWRSSESTSASDATTVRVLDAFTSGGAQVEGGRRSHSVNVGEDLWFTLRKVHKIGVGGSVNGGVFRGDERRNQNGTFTFASLDMFAAGVPTTFTERIVVNPVFEYSTYRTNWYVQDDYRVRNNLLLNLGVRGDAQSHLSQPMVVSPRLGLNWTIMPRRKTAIRASAGIFRQGYDAGIYEQTILVNGVQQRDVVVANPGYPNPFSDGTIVTARPPSVIRARPDLVFPTNRRVTVGLDQPLAAFGRFRATYSRQRGDHVFRSRDINAPIDGVRPDPAARNITELETTARSANRSLELDLQLKYPKRRLSTNFTYTLGSAWNETDGPFQLPPDSLDLSEEWGPSRGDVRHRFNAGANADLWSGFRITTSFRALSASPYTITTGFDTNGDGENDERPAGVGRNSARGAGTQNLDATITWGRGFGQRAVAGAQAPKPGTAGNAAEQKPRPNPSQQIIRFEIFVRGTNVLNQVNYQGFSGVLTSPFFGRPTSAATARRLVLGTRVWF